METIDFLRNLGRAVADRRRGLKLTQEKLAERIQGSPQWVSEVERGAGHPSVAMLLKFAEALEMAPAALVASACAPEAAPEHIRDLMTAAQALPPDAVRVLTATATALKAEEDRRRNG